MTGELVHPDRNALLKQLEDILERDPLIDEVGYIHPSQFAALGEGVVGSNEASVVSVQKSVDEVDSTKLLDVNVLRDKSTIFWNRDHKLAISTQALFPLYNAAKQAFITAHRQYKLLIRSPIEKEKILDVKVTDGILISEEFLLNEVMKHSKALLLLSCDHGTAWNSRKHVLSKKQHFSLLMDELLLSSLVLSYSPKSEQTWSHRRWVIKTIGGIYPGIQEIIERESELVEKIAEKSKMNYRAWNYRCWLVGYMTREQVLNQLNGSKKWAELHVGDSSCFHYRQLLINRMLEHNHSKHGFALFSCCMPDVYHVWMEELDWDEMLIKRYIGREALWVHRRFLSQFGIAHFSTNVGDAVNCDMDKFINGELELLQACLTAPDNKFEDGQAQGVLAAAYILWVSKQLPNSPVVELQDKLRDLAELKTILHKLCPQKNLLWDDLIG